MSGGRLILPMSHPQAKVHRMFELVEPIATVTFSEVARHIPWVWGKTTPAEAVTVRERGSATALRQMIGELADSPGLVRAADLATRAAGALPPD